MGTHVRGRYISNGIRYRVNLSSDAGRCSLLSMKDLGFVEYFLGVQFRDMGSIVFLTQEAYIDKILDRFNMSTCSKVHTPMLPGQDWSVFEYEPVAVVPYKEAIGALLFRSTRTRPDIYSAVSMLCRFAAAPRDKHWTAVKRIMRYLKGKKAFRLLYPKNTSANTDLTDMLNASSDADWASSCADRKSMSRMAILFGKALVSWRTQKQKSEAMSTSEAEYIALSECAKGVRWMRELIKELGVNVSLPTLIAEDKSGAIA